MEKLKELMQTFLFNARIFTLQLSTSIEIDKLKKYKKNLRYLHLTKTGASEDAIHGFVARDSKEQAEKIVDLFKQIRTEKRKKKKIVKEQDLCF